VVSRTLPLGQTETFAYDAAGNRTRHTDLNGETTTYSYDALNREVGRDYTNDADVTTTYTATGQVASVTDGRGTTSYSYDSRDRLTRLDYPDGGYVEYGYDAAGNRVRLTTPHGETTYAFDVANRLTEVTDTNGTTTYSYNAVGSRAGVSYPNGVETDYSYDRRNRLTRIETRDDTGTVLLGLTYTHNDNGTRARISEDSGRVVDYAYDALDRLIEEAVTDAAVGNRTTSWSYDDVGNRLTETTNSVAGTEMVTYSYDANDRLQSETGPAGTTTYDYDANGNLTQRTAPDGTVTYSWSDDDRLVGANDGSQSVSYTYDVDGIRQSQSVDGVTTDYLVDPNRDYAEVLAEADASGNALVRYTHADDLVAQDRGGATAYYHSDALGSTRLLTDPTGTATDSYVYEAFGETEAETGSTENDYRFTGEVLDQDLGLYYLRARYMDPSVGRFSSMDKWAGRSQRPLTLNKYLYAKADPVGRIDPSGRFSLSGFGAAARGIAINATRAVARVGGSTVRTVLRFGRLAKTTGIRVQYMQRVRKLGKLAAQMRRQGKTSEEIAKTVSRKRRALGRLFKNATDPKTRQNAYARNIREYGDKWGPTWQYFRNQGYSWEQIIEKASRPNSSFIELIKIFFRK
jgi:RHS repeat-associated protein